MGASDVVPKVAAVAAAGAAAAAWIYFGSALRRLRLDLQERRLYEAAQSLEQAVTRGRTRVPQDATAHETAFLQKPTTFLSTVQRTLSSPALKSDCIVIKSEQKGSQAEVPLLVYTPRSAEVHPVVIVIHATGSCKEAVEEHLKKLAGMGFMAVAMDCRYHGERATGPDGRTSYEEAIVRAYKGAEEKPFLLDNVWDLMHVIDYLSACKNVDPSRIGVTGISLGGMIAWLAAAVDKRITASAPLIGVHGFKWSLDNNQWHARSQSIPKVFEVAAAEMGKDEIDARVVQAVWERILPGMLEKYDAIHSLPCIAPRPLLILNGEDDRRCPVGSLMPAIEATRKRYHELHAADKFEVYLQTNCGHQATEEMHEATYTFFQRHFMTESSSSAR